MDRRLKKQVVHEVFGEPTGFCKSGDTFVEFADQLRHGTPCFDHLSRLDDDGMEAAIPAVLFSGMLDNQMENALPPEDLFGRLNRSLVRNLDRRTFVCFSAGELDPETRSMRFVNGGCPYPYHYKAATGKTHELVLDALPLGVRAESKYGALECDLEVGDRVVFCSDGIIEANNAEGELFGFEKTSDIIKLGCERDLGSQELIDIVFGEVGKHSGDVEQEDDQTIVVLACG